MELWDKLPIIESSFVKFNIWFVENPGMAFGWDIMPKGMLTILRIIIVLIGIKYIAFLSKKKLPNGCLASLGLIIGGAIGNIIDSVFYGVIFNNAPSGSPFTLFYGQVIDMFYIDIWEGYIPSYIPFIGDSYLSLWPVFNFADSYIFIGVTLLIVFQKEFLLNNQIK